MKRLKKLIPSVAGFFALIICVYFILLSFEDPSFEIIIGAIFFALFGTYFFLEWLGTMEKIGKRKINIGK